MLWLVLVIAFLFTGLRGEPLPAPVVVFGVGATLYALISLGRRFPWFGLFLAMLLANLVGGGRGRRRW